MKYRSVICCLVSILTVVGCTTPEVSTSDNDRQEVAQATTQFYAALNAMFTGDLEPMKTIWSHKDDVTYMDPAGEFHIGWDKVLASWEAQAAMKLGGKVEAENMHFTVGRDIAVTHNYEKGENMNAEGETEMVSIRATNVFRKEEGKWKMVGHHTDLLPFLKK